MYRAHRCQRIKKDRFPSTGMTEDVRAYCIRLSSVEERRKGIRRDEGFS